jgi:DNA mismatch repair ATPase MutL
MLPAQALKSATEEYARIVDIVSRYAVYKTGVAFSCKRHVSVHWVLAGCMQADLLACDVAS